MLPSGFLTFGFLFFVEIEAIWRPDEILVVAQEAGTTVANVLIWAGGSSLTSLTTVTTP